MIKLNLEDRLSDGREINDLIYVMYTTVVM